jgi:hypothetical protein
MTRVSRAYLVDHDSGAEIEVAASADVTVDRQSAARRVVSAEIYDADPDLVVAPNRLRILSGYRVSGVEHLAPLAHVRIGTVERRPLGVLRVTGSSFESLVAADRFARPRRIEGSAVAAIVRLLSEAVPWARVRLATARDVMLPPSGLVVDRERLEAVVGREGSLATAVGVDVFCEGDGGFVVANPPTVQDTAWDTTGFLADWSSTVDPSTVVNSWVVSTDHPDVPPMSVVLSDELPSSPTRVSRWGVSRQFFASPVLSSLDAVSQAAATLLEGSRGVRMDLTLTTPPNPWADVTEPVVAVTDSGRAVLLLDRVTHRVSPSMDESLSMSCTARLVSLT